MLARLRVTIAARVDQKVRDQVGNGEGAHARSVPTEVDGAGRESRALPSWDMQLIA